MNHADHVNLLRDGIPSPGGVWADFGSGTGAFTLALAELVGPDGEIYSIDKDPGALRQQERAMRTHFHEHDPTRIHYLTSDFTRPVDLPPLDGAIMANALHFFREKGPVVRLIRNCLRKGGTFILVEYNVDRGNYWVPYPLAYKSWEDLARQCEFQQTRRLATVPSRFLKEIYAAASVR